MDPFEEMIQLTPLAIPFDLNRNGTDEALLQDQISVLLRKQKSMTYRYQYLPPTDKEKHPFHTRRQPYDTNHNDFSLKCNVKNVPLADITQEPALTAEETVSSNAPSSIDNQIKADEICRLRMSEWCYKICDYLGASRSTVSIAFNYLDRFLAHEKYTRNSTFAYKLASITCLNIALKVHNRTTVQPSDLAELSRGEITVQDILGMESMILNTLGYKLCPPVSHSFICTFTNFLPSTARNEIGQYIVQKAFFLSELSTMVLSCKSMPPSFIAFAAILNTLDEIDDTLLSKSDRDIFVQKIEECLEINVVKTSPDQVVKSLTLDRARVMLSDISHRSTYLRQGKTDATTPLISSEVHSSNHFDETETRQDEASQYQQTFRHKEERDSPASIA